jgi:hypothetical protein
MLTTVLEKINQGSLFAGGVFSTMLVVGQVSPAGGGGGDHEAPISALAALIAIATAAVTLLGWIVKRQYDTIDRQNDRLERISVSLHAVEKGLEGLSSWNESCKRFHEKVETQINRAER